MSGARTQKTILFAQLGPFSYTNDALLSQLEKEFPDYKIESLRVFDILKKQYPVVLTNVLNELVNFGPSIVTNKKLAHEYFLKTPYLFKWMSQYFRNRFGGRRDIAAVFQTQGLFNAALPGVPLVCYLDSTAGNKAFAGANVGGPRIPRSFLDLEKTLYKRADALAVTATHVRTSLLDEYGCDPSSVSIVYIGANVPFVSDPVSDDRYSKQQILFVGIDWTRKGGPCLIEAFSSIAGHHPRSRLLIVGCSPSISHPQIEVRGRVPPAQVAKLITGSSIFCLPSIIEPSSVAVIEACRGKLPIVGTRVGGFLDSVEHMRTGLLVPPGDPTALAGALAYLLDRPELCNEMGRNGALRAAELFDWDAVGVKVAGIIRAQITNSANV